MMQCSICGQFFNPAMLSEVFEHQHKDIATDKEYYGQEVKELMDENEKFLLGEIQKMKKEKI